MSQNDTDLSPEQLEFFNLFKSNKYNVNYFYKKYGKEKVDEWCRQDWFIIKMAEHYALMAKDQEYTIEQNNNLRNNSYDVIARALKGEEIKRSQLEAAKFILSGDRSFNEARAKVMGERSAEGNDKRAAPVINLIRKRD